MFIVLSVFLLQYFKGAIMKCIFLNFTDDAWLPFTLIENTGGVILGLNIWLLLHCDEVAWIYCEIVF